MNTLNQNSVTQYPDVNRALSALNAGIAHILGENLVGVYLMGSLTYDAFDPNTSDIDLVVILNKPATHDQLVALKEMHVQVGKENTIWAKRIECSYVPREMLVHILPPKTPRPYFGEGIFYAEAPYGNEWLINQFLLYTYGIALNGPDFKTLIKPIHIEDVQKACVRDLLDEWIPKIDDDQWLSNSHYQSYLILNLCRILYTVFRGALASKSDSAHWVKAELCPEWRPLIESAEQWQYGHELNFQDEAKEFIKFVSEKVSTLSIAAL